MRIPRYFTGGQRIDDLFHSVLEREPEERAAFLAHTCAEDESLRRKVEALLQAHNRADTFLDAPALVGSGASMSKTLPKTSRPRRGRADLARLRCTTDEAIRKTSPPELADLPADFWADPPFRSARSLFASMRMCLLGSGHRGRGTSHG